jgi:hypothetical protein
VRTTTRRRKNRFTGCHPLFCSCIPAYNFKITSYRRAIEQEKVVYKDSFEQLRSLKPEIEHIKKMMEKCRFQMQQQFDQWYSNLHARTDLMSLGHYLNNAAANESQHIRHQAGPGDMYTPEDEINMYERNPGVSTSGQSRSSVSSRGDPTVSPRSSTQRYQAHESIPSVVQAGQSQAFPPGMLRSSVGTNSGYGSGPGQATGSSNISGRESRHKEQAGNVNNSKTSSMNVAAESDVNEDIALFYQAKEELLKRRANGGR